MQIFVRSISYYHVEWYVRFTDIVCLQSNKILVDKARKSVSK